MAPFPKRVPNLPDLCILTIFRGLPIKDLLTVRLVNHGWHNLSHVTLRKRKSLLIEFSNSSPFVRTGFNLVNFASLSTQPTKNDYESACEWIHSTFPQLKQLRIVLIKELWQMDCIAKLLRKCGGNLVRLELTCKLDCISPKTSVSKHQFALLDTINQLPSLKGLVCKFDHPFITFAEALKRIDLPVLSQLEHFSFASTDDASFLMAPLGKYASHKLRHIEIANCGWNQLLPVFLDSQNEYHFAPRLCDIHLYLNKCTREGGQFARLIPHLTSISTLSINVDKSVNYQQLIGQLGQLPALTNLRLSLNGCPNSGPFTLAPLSSVKNLKLVLNKVNCHKDLVSRMQLEKVFPCLDRLRVDFDIHFCRACTHSYDGYGHLTMEYRKGCARGISSFFKRLQSVHKKEFTFKWQKDALRVVEPHAWTCKELGIEV